MLIVLGEIIARKMLLFKSRSLKLSTYYRLWCKFMLKIFCQNDADFSVNCLALLNNMWQTQTMKRLFNFILNIDRMPWHKVLLLWLTVSVMIISGFFVWVWPVFLEKLQANTFEFWGDLLIISMAFVFFVLITTGTFLAGHLLGWLFWRLFEVAPEAMLQIQSLSALVTSVSPQFYVSPLQIVNHSNNSAGKLFEKGFSLQPLRTLYNWHHSSPILSPRSTSPYRLFPVSCILLNWFSPLNSTNNNSGRVNVAGQ